MSDAAFYPAPLWRRLLAMIYEGLIVLALLFAGSLVYIGIVTALGINPTGAWRLRGPGRHIYQIYLVLLLAAYFGWFWHRGQTLAMRAWRLTLVDPEGKPPSLRLALGRFCAALLLLGPAVPGLLWIREHAQSAWGWAGLLPGLLALAWTRVGANGAGATLYDRLASTRLMAQRPPRRSAPLNPPHHQDRSQ
jgi:uncharacterized RDD family membrane protein YckC